MPTHALTEVEALPVSAPVMAAPIQPIQPTMPEAVSPLMFEVATPINLEDAVKNSELQVIMAAIQSTTSRLEAAAKLGISPRTLRYKLAQFRERGINEGVSA
jgi:two-component system response regulator FlrC